MYNRLKRSIAQITLKLCDKKDIFEIVVEIKADNCKPVKDRETDYEIRNPTCKRSQS